MKKIYFLLLVSLVYFSQLWGQTRYLTDSINQNDGPYILRIGDKYQIILASVNGNVTLDEMDTLPESLTILSSKGDYQFDVNLFTPSIPAWQYDMPDSLLVMSDPHGNLEAFISVLKAHYVINESFDWTYGDGHLMVIGDIFDRGDDVLPLFWLMYKLDQQASEQGGKLHFLFGNHEDMVLRNNVRYTNKKYKVLAKLLEKDYNSLWVDDSVLGEWLASRNSIEIIGNKLFVHAGIHPEIIGLGLSIPEINDLVREFLHQSKDERSKNELAKFMFGNKGVIWYRGMVKNNKKYNPLTEDELDDILSHFSVDQIFVGHTIFDEISPLFGGKVVTINVSNHKNMDRGGSRGLLIKDGVEYVIYDDKDKSKVIDTGIIGLKVSE